jgi:putative transcriptional regulator
MKRSIGNRILRGLKEFTDSLKEDNVTTKLTCRKVTLDLQPPAYTPKAVRDTRKTLKVSQAVFAQFLGVKPTAVRSWEQGRQAPSEMARRFMDEIRRNPEYWRTRLSESIRVKEAG